MASTGPVVSEEKIFENVDDGRTTDAWLYYKLIFEPQGSCELNKKKREKNTTGSFGFHGFYAYTQFCQNIARNTLQNLILI